MAPTLEVEDEPESGTLVGKTSWVERTVCVSIWPFGSVVTITVLKTIVEVEVDGEGLKVVVVPMVSVVGGES